MITHTYKPTAAMPRRSRRAGSPPPTLSRTHGRRTAADVTPHEEARRLHIELLADVLADLHQVLPHAAQVQESARDDIRRAADAQAAAGGRLAPAWGGSL